jgi:hypothetical protein
MKRIRKIVVHITDKPISTIEQDFTVVAVDGVKYYDSKEELSHQKCLDLALKYGLRVLERWELCKLYDESEEFRKSIDNKWLWSASVNSYYRNYAWRFYGCNGNVSNYDRDYASGARCVGGE